MPVSIMHHFCITVSMSTTSSMQQPQLLGCRSMDLFEEHHMCARYQARHTVLAEEAHYVSV